MPGIFWSWVLIAGLAVSCARGGEKSMSDPGASGAEAAAADSSREVVTLAGGCFWCLEAIFSQVRGVSSVESGYSGGTVPHPSYDEVCTGTTGHAEAVQVTFDPRVVSLHQILEIFFTVHDPTTLNRQGADQGTQYRSAIFYRSEAQKAAAENVMQEISHAGIWDRPLVTELVPLQSFYKAEGYHQEYYEKNPQQPYCALVIQPKVIHFREKFKELLVPPAAAR
jgi:peptide-methionine (S)-S-oxide reductase